MKKKKEKEIMDRSKIKRMPEIIRKKLREATLERVSRNSLFILEYYKLITMLAIYGDLQAEYLGCSCVYTAILIVGCQFRLLAVQSYSNMYRSLLLLRVGYIQFIVA